jgi:hypothetical protein
VLIIIGLIVGGIVVGQSLISAAAVRAQISQIEKYNTAVNTFRGKYGYLPGDMTAATAAQLGFPARGSGPGEGDGNGVIQGAQSWGGANSCVETAGETAVFWEDLSQAGLISGTFNTASATPTPPFIAIPATSVSAYLPPAMIGQNNYVYVFSAGAGSSIISGGPTNYFGLSPVASIDSNGYIESPTGPGLTVLQAQSVDNKIDDGLPQSGNVIAAYSNYSAVSWQCALWAAGGLAQGNGNPSNYVSGSPTTCFDNGGNSGAPFHYSVSQNNGAGVNCSLSFQFQ